MKAPSPASSARARRFQTFILLPLAVGLSPAPVGAGGSPDAGLSRQDRIEAKRTLLQFYADRQIGCDETRDAVSISTAERMIREQASRERLLRDRWNRTLTAVDLVNETERIVRSSRMPDRLDQMFGLFGHDPLRVREFIARPLLVDRWVRQAFARDAEIHLSRRTAADDLRRRVLTGSLPPQDDHPARSVEVLRLLGTYGTALGCPIPDLPDAGETARCADRDEFLREARRHATPLFQPGPVVELEDRFEFEVVLDRSSRVLRVATYVIAKLPWDDWWATEASRWPGVDLEVVADGNDLPGSAGTDASGCGDAWDNGILDDVPIGRQRPSAVWTGSVAIYWGGDSLNTGGRYDPTTDSWSLVSTVGAPSGRLEHSAVWTGSEMIVWGGYQGVPGEANTGGRYNPITDSWVATSTVGAPSPRAQHSAVWIGSRMFIWGGVVSDTYLNTGGLYDPSTDTWTPTSGSGAPSARSQAPAVWTGSRVVVWGGVAPPTGVLGDGGRFDPGSNSWSPMSGSQAPSARTWHSALWTGSRMVIWGGWDGSSPLASGGRYDPTSDTWSKLATRDAPSARRSHGTVWTGSQMLVWGGQANNGDPYLNTGGRYDPTQDRWSGMSTTLAPSGRSNHGAVFGAGRMIVWGGSAGKDNTGGRYDPTTDSWTPTSTAGAPKGRSGNTNVWTGTHMIVWGGFDSAVVNTGGRYDPAMDAWSSTTTVGAPSARLNHTAVWTGSRMIVWGGADALGIQKGDGRRYDPIGDQWETVSSTNAPAARYNHVAVWTGSRMVVWGGGSTTGSPITGGRYEPSTDTWLPTSTTNAPLGRQRATAVWTGSKMIVWGSRLEVSGWCARDGGVYDPVGDTWFPTSMANPPDGCLRHTAVWGGNRMIVWGGDTNDGFYWRTGRRYDPETDTWTPTSLVNHPLQRSGHSAVWTGSEMIVWGGQFSQLYADGGRYDPVTDSWKPMSTLGATPRSGHTAVWSGSRMIVWGGDGDRNDGGRYIPPAPAPAGSATMTLAKSGATATLSWGAIADATAFDVARGSIASLRQSSGDFTASTDSCLADDVAGTTADDTQAPAVDNGYWYLVRPVRCSAAGSYDSAAPTQVGTRDAEIAASGMACP